MSELKTVAWMHDGNTRVDIAHEKVKNLWLHVRPQQMTHYTIPLVRRSDAQAEIDRLKAECEALRMDAERYRHVRHYDSYWSGFFSVKPHWDCGHWANLSSRWCGAQLDKAIDEDITRLAAIAKERK